ncbi:hypothetical protein T12_3123 [Trichinella patagoniensis]|uniref:Uncharacterized protein n=1 Tax=Trichinella patagoniensis TaxID=990121 RepID=A0A0V1AEB3_9BILA|nr:hypothetical protein T12_3123 [Trichinella patagoniensis]
MIYIGSESVGRDPPVGREQLLGGSQSFTNRILLGEQNHYFCSASHSTQMLSVPANPRKQMEN